MPRSPRVRFKVASSILSLTGSVAGVVAWSACGESYGDGTETPLPDRNFNDDSGSGSETSTGGGGGDDAGGGGGGVDDGSAKRDADAAIDAAGCCDCDGDGYLRASCTKDLSLIDCDDSDPRRHPKADYLFDLSPADKSHAGDWDCSGTVEKKIATNLVCSSKIANCTGTGFQGDPGCGVQADLVQCDLQLTICNVKVITTGARQSCK